MNTSLKFCKKSIKYYVSKMRYNFPDNIYVDCTVGKADRYMLFVSYRLRIRNLHKSVTNKTVTMATITKF